MPNNNAGASGSTSRSQSPDSSDADSDGGAPLSSPQSSPTKGASGSSLTGPAGSPEHQPSRTVAAPNMALPASVGMSSVANFEEIRSACRAAQLRLSAGQNYLNRLTGLAGADRQVIYEELRLVGQEFIRAQQIAATIEGIINADRAQCQIRIQNLIRERDLAVTQKDKALRDRDAVRSRLDMAQNRLSVMEKMIEEVEKDKRALEQTYRAHIEKLKGENKVKDAALAALCEKPTKKDSPEPKPTRDDKYQARERGQLLARGPGQYGGFVGGENFGNQPYGPNYNRFAPGPAAMPQPSPYRYPSISMRPGPPEASTFDSSYGHNRNTTLFGYPSGGQRPRHVHESSPLARYPGRGPVPEQARTMRPPSSSTWGSSSEEPESFMVSGSGSRVGNNHDHAGYVDYGNPQIQTYTGLTPRPRTGGSPYNMAGMSNALVPLGSVNNNMDPESVEWQERFDKLFHMIHGWVKTYCDGINFERTEELANNFRRLFDYICSITYPDNHRNAVNHGKYMLNDPMTRCHFIARLLTQYVVTQMLSPEAWKGFNPDVDTTLSEVVRKTAGTVLTSYERQQLLDRQNQAVRYVLGSSNWQRFRQIKTNAHVNRFKDIVGPLLNQSSSKADASLDLHGIAVNALDLSAKILTSRYTFVFIFNECGIKFADNSHTAINNDTPGLELQLRQWRLMCVVTPGITYRDETGISVIPKCVAKAKVLVMQ